MLLILKDIKNRGYSEFYDDGQSERMQAFGFSNAILEADFGVMDYSRKGGREDVRVARSPPPMTMFNGLYRLFDTTIRSSSQWEKEESNVLQERGRSECVSLFSKAKHIRIDRG